MKQFFSSWLCLILLTLTVISFAEEPFAYEDKGRRDPFWRLVNSSGAIMNYESDILLGDMVLEGIITGPNQSNLAIINGTIVKQNDMIGLFVVEKIDQDEVFLRKDEESSVLKLKKEE